MLSIQDVLETLRDEKRPVYRAQLAEAIEAAMREPVAWRTEDYLSDKSATTYDPQMAKRWEQKGWQIFPLFEFPPDAQAEIESANADGEAYAEIAGQMQDEIERLKEEIEIAECLQDSQYLAGVTAGWNAANSDNPNEAKARIYKLREGRLKPLFAIREKRKARAALAGKEGGNG